MASIGIESALTPTKIDAVSRLLSEVASAGNAFSNTSNAPLASRLDLLAKAQELARALETPRETMVRHVWVEVCRVTLTASAGANKIAAYQRHGHLFWDTDRPVVCHGKER